MDFSVLVGCSSGLGVEGEGNLWKLQLAVRKHKLSDLG